MNTTLPRINESHRDIPPGSISISQFTQLTAVERSNALLFVKTEPYLQVSPFTHLSSIVAHVAYFKVYVRTFIEVGSWFKSYE